MKPDHLLTPDTKINLKWIKDLHVRPKIIKTLEENTDSSLFDISYSNIFQIDVSPEARETKAKINYWDHIKIKSFCTGKEIINKIKRQPMEWETVLYTTYF